MRVIQYHTASRSRLSVLFFDMPSSYPYCFVARTMFKLNQLLPVSSWARTGNDEIFFFFQFDGDTSVRLLIRRQRFSTNSIIAAFPKDINLTVKVGNVDVEANRRKFRQKPRIVPNILDARELCSTERARQVPADPFPLAAFTDTMAARKDRAWCFVQADRAFCNQLYRMLY